MHLLILQKIKYVPYLYFDLYSYYNKIINV